ncbi:MAG: hypothetical protein V4724_25255 [Pseudomonadota bacterium]
MFLASIDTRTHACNAAGGVAVDALMVDEVRNAAAARRPQERCRA